jgi:hypothetical protein
VAIGIHNVRLWDIIIRDGAIHHEYTKPNAHFHISVFSSSRFEFLSVEVGWECAARST